MSYPSVSQFLPENATEYEARQAIWQAIQIDLKLGVEWIKQKFGSLQNGEQAFFEEDPNSVLGKQIARLIGADTTRQILEEELGLTFRFYNCCGVGAKKGGKLKIDFVKQALSQVTPDC
jgi:hypothetical protein